MTIDDLVTTLSRGDPRPTRLAPTTNILLAASLALLFVLTSSITWLELRPDFTMELAIYNRIFALKLIFTASIVACALPIVRDLSVPGRWVRRTSLLAAVPFAVIMALAAGELSSLPVSKWTHHVGEASWLDCLWQIPVLSLPAFVVLVVAVRRLAPTELIRTGACVGLLAGGVGAIGYALHCHDDSIAFVAFSYTAAILEMALLGALLGPRVLRWA
jgi:hypothetical protein